MPSFVPTRLAYVACVCLVLGACPSNEPQQPTESGSTGTDESSTSGSPTGTEGCDVGAAGCTCTGGGGCNPGLECNADQICVPIDDDTTVGPDSETTEPPSTTETTGSDTTAETGDTTTTVGRECTPTGDGSMSPECVQADPTRPFCGPGETCVGCDELAEDACSVATAGELPICGSAGACVECDAPNALELGQCGAASPHCNLDTNECEGCLEHAECPTTACEIEARKCFPEDRVLFVRKGPTPNNPCSDVPGNGGNMAKPYCDVDTAIAAAQLNGFSSGWTFKLLASDSPATHGAVVFEGGDVEVSYAFVHEPGGQLENHTRFVGFGPLVVVPNKVNIYLVDFTVQVDKPFADFHIGVDCQPGGRLWLDDSRVLYARGPGIKGNDCAVHLRRSVVAFGKTEGVDISGGTLRLENSFITRNSWIQGANGGGIRLRNGAALDVNYSTLVENSNQPDAMLGDTITCDGPAAVKVRNSILGRLPGTNNPSVVCPEADMTVINSVVDGEFGQDTGNKKVAPEDIMMKLSVNALTGTAKIPNPEDALTFAGVAVWEMGDPHDDCDREPRPGVVSSPDFAGADVLAE